jgi:hypothetical protein
MYGLQESLVAADARYDFRDNRHTFSENGIPEATWLLMDNYERIAVFGGFVLGSQQSAGFLVLCETAPDDGQTMVSVLNTGQKGLDALHDVHLPKLCGDVKNHGLADLHAGDIAAEMLSEPEFEEPVILAVAVEVYENLDDNSTIPIFSFNRGLKNLAYRVRNRLPHELTEFSCDEVKTILAASKDTEKAFIVEAAVDLLPENVDEYFRAESQS